MYRWPIPRSHSTRRRPCPCSMAISYESMCRLHCSVWRHFSISSWPSSTAVLHSSRCCFSVHPLPRDRSSCTRSTLLARSAASMFKRGCVCSKEAFCVNFDWISFGLLFTLTPENADARRPRTPTPDARERRRPTPDARRPTPDAVLTPLPLLMAVRHPLPPASPSSRTSNDCACRTSSSSRHVFRWRSAALVNHQRPRPPPSRAPPGTMLHTPTSSTLASRARASMGWSTRMRMPTS